MDVAYLLRVGLQGAENETISEIFVEDMTPKTFTLNSENVVNNCNSF